ncbi:MAG: DUF1553 domain-containing protein [Planctomycetaceae bacterium]
MMRSLHTTRRGLITWTAGLSVLLTMIFSVRMMSAADDPGKGKSANTVVPNKQVNQTDVALSEILKDRPVALWTFAETKTAKGASSVRLQNDAGEESAFTLVQKGRAASSVPGPRPSEFPDFLPTNTAALFSANGSYLSLADPGANSPLDFTNGDSITMECWVRWEGALSGTFPYLMGKGRTHRAGFSKENQNYALRLANNSSGVFPSFLFATEPVAGETKGDAHWHRWVGNNGIPEDGAWHHVAVSYTFGKPESIAGYVDGVPTKGKWDMGGTTSAPPVSDDDELWVGSSMGGTSTFTGEIDNLALYREALTPARIRSHVNIQLEHSPLQLGVVDAASVPQDRVKVEMLGGIPVAKSWKFRLRPMTPLYETDTFAIEELPREYNAKGLIVDRAPPLLIHLSTRITLPEGEHEFVLRTLDSVRLYIDGKLLTTTRHMEPNSSAHGKYYDLPELGDAVLSIPAGHVDERIKVTLAAGEHVISLYRLVGHKGKSPYVGELALGVGPVGGPYRFVSPSKDIPFTDAGWLQLREEHRLVLRDWEQQVRQTAAEGETKYWKQRHDYARSVIAQKRASANKVQGSPTVSDAESTVAKTRTIDSFVEEHLKAAGKKSMPLVDDYAFLRRVTLDTTGTIPTPEAIEAFFADPVQSRRQNAIERLLADAGWADHWVGYWQDVLAENPGLTKPELNNTGPFRWFLYESFLDNKPMDRFVTELVMMEGSKLDGGPAGFLMASQNDAPMAAKAHILGTAFLGVEMKCARCHDAPYHDLKQRDLFSIAAMLGRSPQKVPGTSSIPATPEALAKMAVKVTLKPGESVKPDWPFVEFVSFETPSAESLHQNPATVAAATTSTEALPKELFRNPGDSRELLAAQLTSPHNQRFAKVVVNRLWKRYMGRGLVEPVDDWEGANCEHPELLDWLADEFVTHNFDLKHVARLILSSRTYQRIPAESDPNATDAALFAGPVRRRMTGEQIADSLMGVSGKSYASEELTMDADGKQAPTTFIHLGNPTRAWQFVAVSNERDRPSLNLPVAQSVVDLMAAYGWRQQRQDPLTDRDDGATPLQPMALAHGTTSNRAIDFSDDSAFTTLALREQAVEEFIDQLFVRILTRPATTEERQRLQTLLEPGYDQRIVAGPEAALPPRIFRSGITWANHFDPKSDVEAMTRQRDVLQGDRPTPRLNADWRERAEDAVWSLVNHPEFVFIP